MRPDSELTEIGGQSVNGRPELAESVTSRPVKRRLPRYHEALMAAFATGASVGEAARLAGVSERTAQRWKACHGTEVLAARRGVLDGLLSKVRAALPAALERLENIAKNSEDEGVAVRASLGLWDIFGRVSDRMELEERLSALEARSVGKTGGSVQ
jgi:transposase-like protein